MELIVIASRTLAELDGITPAAAVEQIVKAGIAALSIDARLEAAKQAQQPVEVKEEAPVE